MLMYTELVSLLKYSALCADWPQEARVALADKCSIRSVKKETPLFSQGQPATHFYLLANGQVSMGLRTQTGSEREVYQLQGPASFGEVYMLMQDRKSTRLNSSHVAISYGVCILYKKKKNYIYL